MKILVTGVTGFIGGALSKVLVADGHQVASLVRMTSRWDTPIGVSLYRGSLTDREAVRWAVKDFQPEAVCHLGAITPVAYSFDHPNEVIEANLLGTVNLAEACMREARVERFIFASSMEVYGEQFDQRDGQTVFTRRNRPYTEKDPTEPSCPYAVAKLACEKYLAYLGRHHDFPWVALRQTNAYGRPSDSRFVVEGLMQQMAFGNPEVRAGARGPVRNFMYISDLVELYCRLLYMEHFWKVAKGFYTVGPDNALSIEQLAELIAFTVGWSGKMVWDTLPKRPGEVHYLSSSNQCISGLTGWRPAVSLGSGLKLTMEKLMK